MAVRGSEYVQAAQCLGFSDRVTLFRHVLPNAFGPVVAYAVSDAVLVMLAGASFGFLGMPQPPLAEWGVMFDGTRFLRQAWWICTFGLAAISLGLASSSSAMALAISAASEPAHDKAPPRHFRRLCRLRQGGR